MFVKRLTALFALSCLVGCQSSSHLTEFKSNQTVANELTQGEKRLWSQAVDIDEQLRRSGKLMRDADANTYLNKMLFSLYPEFKDELQIFIVKAPILNAFALPNGSLYIHSGIIAAAQNDSQLAAVVAHEAAHFSKRHSAKNRISAANSTSFAVFLNLMGIPFIGELIGISSMMGFSRDLEREADAAAIQRMLTAGYDITEAHKMFEFLASDALANQVEHPVFFASHPALQERISSFKSFTTQHQVEPTTGSDDKAYKDAFSKVRYHAVKEKLELGFYSSLINEYKTVFSESIYANNVEELFYFGEAFRLRGEEGDSEQALQLINEFLQHFPIHSKAHMSIGIICLDQNNYPCARDFLLKAKEFASGPSGYIDMYLKKLSEKEKQNEI